MQSFIFVASLVSELAGGGVKMILSDYGSLPNK